MKKLITYATLCLIAILVLPSCKSKMGITKRHYTKGYYVSHSKGKDRPTITKTQSKSAKATELEPIKVSNIKTVNEPLKDQAIAQPKMIASAAPNKASNIFTGNNKGYESEVAVEQIEERESATMDPGNAGDEKGLSLFWIIILVILILWLFGFLAGGFGFGGLINVLLIIALILLILWLLRIV